MECLSGAKPHPSKPEAGGNTLVDWTISANCEYQEDGTKFREFTVNFQLNVHIRKGVNDSLVKQKEQDHINDYINWAKTVEKTIENDFERRYWLLTFSSVEECKEATQGGLQSFLETVIQKSHFDTRHKWDGEGRPHG